MQILGTNNTQGEVKVSDSESNTVAEFVGAMHNKLVERYLSSEPSLSEQERRHILEQFLSVVKLTTSFSFHFTTEAFPKPMKIAFIMRRLREILQPMFPKQTFLDISIALEEIIANILEHSYSAEEQGDIYFRFFVAPLKVTIEVDDYGEKGKKFDFQEIGHFQSLEDLRKTAASERGGMGVYLVRKVMDEVNYSTISGQYNRVTMVKYLK